MVRVLPSYLMAKGGIRKVLGMSRVDFDEIIVKRGDFTLKDVSIDKKALFERMSTDLPREVLGYRHSSKTMSEMFKDGPVHVVPTPFVYLREDELAAVREEATK